MGYTHYWERIEKFKEEQLIITGYIRSYYLHPPFSLFTVKPSYHPTTRYERRATNCVGWTFESDCISFTQSWPS